MENKEEEVLEDAFGEEKDPSDLLEQQPKSPNPPIKQSRWKKLSLWSLVFAVCSLVITFHEVIPDIIEYLTRFDIRARCYLSNFFSLVFYVVGLNFLRIKFITKHPLIGKFFLLLGAILTAFGLYLFAQVIDLKAERYSHLVFLAAAIYGGVGYMGRSQTLWSLALLLLGVGFGLRWTYSNGDYIFGISKPCNFVLLGLLLIFLFSIFNFHKQTQIFAKSTLFFGLFYLFMALWSLSICGTHDSNSNSDLLFFGIVFGGVALLSLYLGIKYDIVFAQWLGGIFFYINLLTKYFEHFWNSYHKSIFFAILGLFFLIITLTVGKFSQISSKLKEFSSRYKKRSKE
ncbi:MAG: hypothetical protein LBD60_00615 [Puniceicoccales bacterium]|jgi:hypothetical protein|nr:hypothetical protein [Puniceicoccales bacterium]